MWMNLVSVTQSEVSQKEKTNITHINFWLTMVQTTLMQALCDILLAQRLCFNCIHIWYGESLSVLNPKSLLAINISLDRTSEHQPAFYNIYPSSWQLSFCLSLRCIKEFWGFLLFIFMKSHSFFALLNWIMFSFILNSFSWYLDRYHLLSDRHSQRMIQPHSFSKSENFCTPSGEIWQCLT